MTTVSQLLRTIMPTDLLESARNLDHLLDVTWKTGFLLDDGRMNSASFQTKKY
jgi:hypothetical protein